MERNAKHLDWRQAVDAADGLAAAEHLSGCFSCQDLVESARKMIGALRYQAVGPSPDRAESLVRSLPTANVTDLAADITWALAEADRLSGVVSAGQTLRQRLTDALRRFEAVLKADSSTNLAVAVRGSSESANRVLVYETPLHSLSMAVEPSADPSAPGTDVTGQLVPQEGGEIPADSRLWLELEDGEEREAELDSFGQFEFADLPTAPVRMTVILGEDLIDVGPFPPMESR